MKTIYEILGRHESEIAASSLLYAPLPEAPVCRRSTVYEVEYEGDAAALDAFVRKVLFDEIAQELRQDAGPAFPGFAFVLDIAMKGGVLDHERESILSWHRHHQDAPFTISKLRVIRRLYVFGAAVEPAPFIRDLVNPAIQNYEITHGQRAA